MHLGRCQRMQSRKELVQAMNGTDWYRLFVGGADKHCDDEVIAYGTRRTRSAAMKKNNDQDARDVDK